MKILIALILMIFSSPVLAYLDPGTGSLIIQGVVAGVAATILAVKVYWYKLVGFFGKTSNQKGLLEEEDG